MIDAATADALGRIAALRHDLLHGYDAGFEPSDRTIAAREVRSLPSLDRLTVVAPRDAYFVGSDARGALRLTRDGAFRFADGALRFSDGAPVFGYTDSPAGRLVPLRIDRIDAALGRVVAPRIEADGTLAYTRTAIEPRTGAARDERVVIGRLALARLPAGTLPVVDGTRLQAPNGIKPLLGVPSGGAFAPLLTNARDVGSVNLTAGLQRLQEAYVSFEALQAAHLARIDAEKATLDLVK